MLQYCTLLALAVAYTWAVFAGHSETMRKVFYSTSAPGKISNHAESNSKPLDLRPLWTYKSQITSSTHIEVPADAITATTDFPVIREFFVVCHDIHTPKNLQPLTFPSKPRDPPVA
ncbi:MAG: hypothetical protein EPO24_00990 [Bacteroidetes bacterium]|nr:MAG: hypothetical protein EPO24_00990 [Bacteroidota bacterium]